MKKFLTLLLGLLISSNFYSQNVTLTVIGDGATKDEAIKNALRSAIEQSYGTFISSNTTILNEDVVKDEIVSVSRGNIKKYNEIASIKDARGRYNVTVEAVVSIEKLANYAKSKGCQAELSGAAFGMNLKMRQLNTKNEEIALQHLRQQVEKMLEKDLWTYDVKIREPKETPEGGMAIKVYVYMTPTEKLLDIPGYIRKVMKKIAMSDSEVSDYKNSGREVYPMKLDDGILYYFRSGAPIPYIDDKKCAAKYILKDNLGHIQEGNVKKLQKVQNYARLEIGVPYYSQYHYFEYSPSEMMKFQKIELTIKE